MGPFVSFTSQQRISYRKSNFSGSQDLRSVQSKFYDERRIEKVTVRQLCFARVKLISLFLGGLLNKSSD